jgi:hypothetical protein
VTHPSLGGFANHGRGGSLAVGRDRSSVSIVGTPDALSAVQVEPLLVEAGRQRGGGGGYIYIYVEREREGERETNLT